MLNEDNIVTLLGSDEFKNAVEEGKINNFRYEFYIRTLEDIINGRKY